MSATSGPATAGPATPTPDPGAPAPTERAGSTARGRVLSIIGVILLPLLIASGFIWATSGSGSRLTRSEAAIVNLDEGSSIGGKPVRLGQTYALELRNQQGPNFTWRYGVTMTEAQRGLADGRYSAAVVIPAGFSRALTGTASGTADDQATLLVERSPLSGVSDQVVFSQLSAAATSSLSGKATSKYLDELFVSSSELGKSLDQSRALADEARQGAGSIAEAARTAQRAAAGLQEKASAVQTQADRSVVAAEQASTTTNAIGEASRSVQTTVGTAGLGGAARDKAVADLAGRAGSVTEAADKAAASTRTAGERAQAAGSQGAATQQSADAVAKAAAANRRAATDYTAKVAAALQQQQQLSNSLADSSKSLNGYVSGTQQAATTVKDTVERLREISGTPESARDTRRSIAPPRGSADAARQLLAQADALDAQARQMVTERLQPIAIADLDQQVSQLGVRASSISSSATEMARANRAVVSATTSAAGSMQQAQASFSQLVAQLTTTQQVTVDETVTVDVPGGVELPPMPPCPRQNNPSYCVQWQKGFESYQSQIQAANQARQVQVPVKATVPVTVRPSQQAISATQGALDQAAGQVNAAGTAASANQAGLDQLASSAGTFASSMNAIATAVSTANTQIATAQKQYDDTTLQLQDFAGQLRALSRQVEGDPTGQVQRQVIDALADPEVDASLTALEQDPGELTQQAAANAELAQRNAETLAAVDEKSEAATTLTTGAEAIDETSAGQAEVVTKLQQTLTSLNSGMGDLGRTMTGLSSDAAALQQQTVVVSDNATATAGEVTALTRTLDALRSSVDAATTDSRAAAGQARAMQRQVSELQQTSSTVRTTTSTLTTQSAEQTGRVDTLSKKVAAASALAPSYTDQERQRLTDIVTTPISTQQGDQFRNVGWLSMLLVLSLWAGAMGLHSVFKPVSDRARQSHQNPLRLLVQEMTPSALISIAQAVGLSVVGQLALGLTAGRWAMLAAAMVLAALVFAAVNHALLSFLRVYGRLIAVGFALVAGASLLTRAAPSAMSTIETLSPITPALGVVRSLMTGAPGGITHLVMMAAWLGVGVLFSALAILRARDPEPVRVPTIYEPR